MKIKKVLPVLALTVALVGCGKKADTTSNASSTPSSNDASTPASDAGSNK